jgi:hypothetical protein
LTTDALACTRERTSGRRHAVDAIAEVVARRHSWRAVQAARRVRRNHRRNGVGSPVDISYRLGDTMSTRTIAIAALVIAVVIVVILFVI